MNEELYSVVPVRESDGLMHWKYIKKVKKNGKWRYYYDVKDALGYDERAALGEATRQYNRAKANSEGYRQIQGDPTREKWYNSKKADSLDRDTVARGRIMGNAKRKYDKTVLGRIDRMDDVIDRGRDVVADLLIKLSDVIRSDKEDYTKY